MVLILEHDNRVVEVTIATPAAGLVSMPCRVLRGRPLRVDDIPGILRRVIAELARDLAEERAARRDREQACRDLDHFWQDTGGEAGEGG